MKTNLIAFSGPMGSGKDTIQKALVLNGKLSDRTIQLSFGKAVKDEVNELASDIVNGASNLDKKYNVTKNEMDKATEIIQKAILSDDKPFDSNNRTQEIREILQFWGTDVRRNQDGDYWVNKTRKEIIKHLNEQKIVMITDARFINEMKLIKELGGVIIGLKISEVEQRKRLRNRDGFVPNDEKLNHISERDWKIFDDYDLVITEKYALTDTVKIILEKYFI